MTVAVVDYAADEKRILEVIDSMYLSISWNDRVLPDFDRFTAAVRNDAVVVPASRPAAPTDIKSFVNRMSGLHVGKTMKSFEEAAHRNTVKVFGNIAVAMGSFTALVDGSANRGVNAWLFIRDAGDWQIAAMAWDNETASTPLTGELA
jgi:Domain of unknown function (DUF4440)